MRPPRVSVLTAVHNSLPYLMEAVASIQTQTFEDFEYLLVDDASTDDSWDLISLQARRDKRIRGLRNPTRGGVAEALNIALRQARGDYVAILDADDLALPERLEWQLNYLDRYPEYGALGAAVRMIDASGNLLRHETYPTHPASARWSLLFGTSLLHSASLFRRQLMLKVRGYSRQHGYLCDYELLCRLADHGKIGNLPEELACYRWHDRQTSAVHCQAQTGQMLLLQYALQYRWLGLRPELATFQALRTWALGHPPHDASATAAAMGTLRTLYQTYLERTPLNSVDDRVAINRSCARRWAIMAHTAKGLHPALSRVCWQEARTLDPDLTGGLAMRRWIRARTLRHTRLSNDAAVVGSRDSQAEAPPATEKMRIPTPLRALEGPFIACP